MDDRELQTEELIALESTLREGKLTRLSDWNDTEVDISGVVQIDFFGTENKGVRIEGTCDDGTKFSDVLKIIPPVQLYFVFPPRYPMTRMPKLNAKCIWMDEELQRDMEIDLCQLCLDNMTMPVLYSCCQVIEQRVNNIEVIDLNKAVILKTDKTKTVEWLRNEIKNESLKAKKEVFDYTMFECEVCFNEYCGTHCYRFRPCKHVFCKQCVGDYFRVTVSGIVSRTLRCLADNCDVEAPQYMIREVLEPELFDKYENAILEKAIREMDDVVECPKPNCQKVAYVNDREMNLASCSYCNFHFCNVCKQTFHGIEPCKLKAGDQEKIIQEWNESNEEQKELMAKRFGGMKNLKEIIERLQNQQWMEANSKPCPKCKVKIEKNAGCHKMHCTKCDSMFCWLCSAILNKENPYKHFKEGACEGRLFEGVVPVEDFDPFGNVELADGDYEEGEEEEVAIFRDRHPYIRAIFNAREIRHLHRVFRDEARPNIRDNFMRILPLFALPDERAAQNAAPNNGAPANVDEMGPQNLQRVNEFIDAMRVPNPNP
ncbi:unnamed protein product [Caenorhabditis bovis]|uniref:RBR-type E3 ubiquitin transferase n=1 Tax=Caenorhabditis bovis TaxID=2654633 RepID=A0A8S1EYM5_9PELO|nr:unnamed protein product [Caenorhabditis bovis]